MRSFKSEVWIAGAGCLDASGLTYQVRNLIDQADVLVYDDLISSEILELFSEEKPKVYVGKRKGKHSFTQDQINQLLINLAGTYEHVLRLKGGDPFIFGRGKEETDALVKAGIPCKVFPGLSSSLTLPLMMGIPATDRRYASGFMVVTASLQKGSDWSNLISVMARFQGTLIILMGLSKAEEIQNALIEKQMDPDMPICVISSPEIGKPEIFYGELQTLSQTASKTVSPATIVIGKTVTLGYGYSSYLSEANAAAGFDEKILTENSDLAHLEKADSDKTDPEKKSLDNKKWNQVSKRISYPESQSAPGKIQAGLISSEDFKERLKIHLPDSIELCSLFSTKSEYPEFPDLKELISNFHVFAFTSRKGAEVFFELMKQQKIDLRKLYPVKIAVIGAGTAEVFSEHGIVPDLISKRATTIDFEEDLKVYAGLSVLLFRAQNADSKMETSMKSSALYLQVKRADLYKVVYTRKSHTKNMADKLDLICFGSSEAIRAWKQNELPADKPCMVLSYKSAEAAKEAGFETVIVSDEISAKGMADTISRLFCL